MKPLGVFFHVGRIGVLGLLGLGLLPGPAGAEEFTGPFASWRNVKTDYGAAGDGRTDDTAALQRALNDLATHRNFCVLYLPAGHYRLTGTVQTRRLQHNDCNGIAIVGESPESTVLQWDGPAGGTVVQYDAWYSRIARLAIDGAGRAGVALAYGPNFSTYNETSDLALRNARVGLELGGDHSMGQAENEVLRCQFSHCTDAGIKTDGFNTLDIWAWYCSFSDCGYGLYNNAGAYQAWQNVFRRSTIADAASRNLEVFSLVNNTSIGSHGFIYFDNGQRGGAPTSICGNRIIDAGAVYPVRLGSGGPYLVMDNTFTRTAGGSGRAVKMTWGAQTFAGNTYTTTNAVSEAGRFRRVGEQTAETTGGETGEAALPPPPADGHRKIIEVRRRYLQGDSGAIQDALNEADHYRGQRPIVHMPPGNYKIMTTLVIPAGSDVQLVGDSPGSAGTMLNWGGPPGGLLLRLAGPARATLRDLHLNAYRARALLVEDADQAGGKIFADELKVNGPALGTRAATVSVLVHGLVKTDVLFRCLQSGDTAGTWMEVDGQGTAAGAAPAANQVAVLTGAEGACLSHYRVADGGRLVVRAVYHEHCFGLQPDIWLTDSSRLAVDACHFTCVPSPPSPLVSLEDFGGQFLLAASLLNPGGSSHTCRLEMAGAGAGGTGVLLNDLFSENVDGTTAAAIVFNRATVPAYAGLSGCGTDTPRTAQMKGGFTFLDDGWTTGVTPASGGDVPAPAGAISDAALLPLLAPLRSTRVWLPDDRSPAQVTDLRIYHVLVDGGPGAVVEFSGGE